MVLGAIGTIAGLVLITGPVIVYQYNNTGPPFGHHWPLYPLWCALVGGLGGILMVPSRDEGSLGYRWVGGLLGGAMTTSLAYLASWRIGQETEDVVDLPLILLCGVPGLITYAIVQRCSDRTFPDASRDYQRIPDGSLLRPAAQRRPVNGT